jgi:hypothetical protein
VKEWVTVIWGPLVFYGIAIIAGSLLFVLGVLSLFGLNFLGQQPVPISARLTAVGVGLVFLAISLVAMIFPAHAVARFADGSFNFTGRIRTLDVLPGDLVRVSSFPNDRGRLMPLLVVARPGRVLLSPSLGEMGDLLDDLADWNPLAIMDLPRRWWTTLLWNDLWTKDSKAGKIDDPIWTEPPACGDEPPRRL